MLARTDRFRWLVRILAVVALTTRPLSAQSDGSLFERLGIDKLRFSSLGLQVGRVNPHGIEPANSL